jgi:hypothetical protein
MSDKEQREIDKAPKTLWRSDGSFMRVVSFPKKGIGGVPFAGSARIGKAKAGFIYINTRFGI